MFRSWSKAI